eukprot:COSAG02_NODE_35188_length_472_cov_0.903485_2_plen_107_part_00
MYKIDWIASTVHGKGWGAGAIKALRRIVFPPDLKTWRCIVLEALDANNEQHPLVQKYAATFASVTKSKWTKRGPDQRLRLLKESAGGKKLHVEAHQALSDYAYVAH